MPLDWTDQALSRGLACYRNGEYFDAHEHWESVWLASPEPDRTFLQSLIQVSAAFHHIGRGNRIGAASLLRRSLARLERYPAEYACIDLSRLRREIAACIQTLADETPSPAAFRAPKIL